MTLPAFIGRSAIRNFRPGRPCAPTGKFDKLGRKGSVGPALLRRLAVNFQVTILKVLVSYPDGFATLADVKRDVAILATSGREWSERTTKLAARLPGLEIFAQALVERRDGGWRITDAGRSALELMERKPAASELPQVAAPEPSPAIPHPAKFRCRTGPPPHRAATASPEIEQTTAGRKRLLGGNPASATSAPKA